MEKNREIKAGDKMWIGSNVFTTKVEDLQEVPITKVGNKYITITKYGNERQFHRDTLLRKSDYFAADKLFFSKEEYEIQKKLSDKQENIHTLTLKINKSVLKKWNEEDLDLLEKLLEKYK